MAELMDLIVDLENQLGLPLPGRGPVYKRRAAAVAQVTRLLDRNPRVTIADLRTAASYCRLNRQPIADPAELIKYIKPAKTPAVISEDAADFEQRIGTAIDIEIGRGDVNGKKWVTRLVRCTGQARRDCLAEWEATRQAMA